jgi:glycosyltransferase involved in cell wall biosynthesis
LRLAIISSCVFPSPPVGYAGLESVAWIRAEGLAKKGHDVTLFAPDGSRCDHATVRPFGPAGQTSEHQAYNSYWQELPSYDCVVDDSWSKFSYILKAEGKLPAPVLGVCHAPVSTMFQSLPPVEKPCMVCISRDQAAHFEALFDRPARVCHNSVCSDYYSPIEGLARNDRFLFLARFSRIKGPLLAMQACKAAEAKLDLVGDVSITNEPDYLQECVNFQDQDRVIVGPASRGECVHWFSRNYCLVHGNLLFREPFGLAPVEAQAAKMPVIAFDRGAMRETILDGQTGWLVRSEQELIDRIRRVKEEGISQEMRDQCRDWVSRAFSVERMVQRYGELIEEAVSTGGW